MSNYAYITPSAPTVQARSGAHCALGSASAGVSAAGGPTPQSVGLAASPAARVSMRGGGLVVIAAPVAVVSAAATVPGVLRAALISPQPVVAASMTAGIAGGTRAPLGCASPIVRARNGAAPVRLSSPAARVSSGALAGRVLGAALTAPRPLLSASATTRGLSYAHIVAPALRPVPSLRASLVAPRPVVAASGSLVAVLEFEAYAINLQSAVDGGGYEVTRYTSFPFSNVVRAHGAYFGVASDGLFHLTGSADDGNAVQWSFQTGLTDFGTPQLKHVAHAYLAGRLAPDSVFSVFCGEKLDPHYSYSTPRGDTAQTYRCLFGKGLRARYYAFGVSGAGPLEVSEMEFMVSSSTRRI